MTSAIDKPRWGALAVGIVVVIAIVALVAVAVRSQKLHREQVAAATARFQKLDAAHSAIESLNRRFSQDYKKMGADLKAAQKAGDKRHDQFYSLSEQQVFDLARSERMQLESVETLEGDVDGLDQRFLPALASIYGENAVAKTRTTWPSAMKSEKMALTCGGGQRKTMRITSKRK